MPSAIVVGGLTLVGRNLVTYLTENNICDPIRVIDRSVPAAAFLNQQCRTALEKVEFRQVNLVNEGNVHDRIGSLLDRLIINMVFFICH
jgi:nucleoside-diphosphate-sugar epimerase